MTHYDYIVIGAGSAGCVVANRLTTKSTEPTEVPDRLAVHKLSDRA